MENNVIIYNPDVHQLREQLRERVVHFIFRKKDGTLRDAYGTTCLDHIPSSNWPKGIDTRKRPDYLINYWDIQRNAWRSFNIDNFYGFEDIGEEEED